MIPSIQSNVFPRQAMADTSSDSQIWAKAYDALGLDHTISHGAFRLWHRLCAHRNRVTGACYPGQRLLAQEMTCDTHSLKRWTKQLQDGGWLHVNRSGQGAVFQYQLLDGKGNPLPTRSDV